MHYTDVISKKHAAVHKSNTFHFYIAEVNTKQISKLKRILCLINNSYKTVQNYLDHGL